MSVNPSIKVADDATGKPIGLSQLANQNSAAEDTFSQAVHEASILVDYKPFFDETDAVRVVTASDSPSFDYLLEPLPAGILAGAVDVSDASVLVIYGSVSVLTGASASSVIVSPIVLTDTDKAGPLLPPFRLRRISPHLALYADVPTEEHQFRAEEGGEIQLAFAPVFMRTMGAKRIGLHVQLKGEANIERVILHAFKTSYVDTIQRLQNDSFDGTWGDDQFSDYTGGA